MIRDLIQLLGGIEVFGAISVCLFFVVFTSAFVWALRLKSAFLNTMASLPLREDETRTCEKGASVNE